MVKFPDKDRVRIFPYRLNEFKSLRQIYFRRGFFLPREIQFCEHRRTIFFIFYKNVVFPAQAEYSQLFFCRF